MGLRPDGRLLAFNSYENRVYQAGMEEGPPLVAKFYRAARWTDAQIVEEHEFARELADAEIPVVAPLAIGGRTLHAARRLSLRGVPAARRPRPGAGGSPRRSNG